MKIMLSNEDLLKISNMLDIKLEVQAKAANQKMQQMQSDICGQMFELREEIFSVRRDLGAEIQNFREDLSTEIQNVREELGVEIQNVREELGAEVQNVREELGAETSDIRGEISGLKADITEIKILLENDIRPRLSTIESCYVEAAGKFASKAEKIDSLSMDVDILKDVALEHSKKLKKIQ